jgi:hypothetical protein
MKGVVASDPVDRGVRERQPVSVVREELGPKVGALAGVERKELLPKVQGGPANVDRDRATTHPIETRGEPASASPEIQDIEAWAQAQLRHEEAEAVHVDRCRGSGEWAIQNVSPTRWLIADAAPVRVCVAVELVGPRDEFVI